MDEQMIQTPARDLREVFALEVKTPEQRALAIRWREDVKALIVEIEGAFKPHIARAYQTHRGLLAELATRLDGPKAALGALTATLGRYEADRLKRNAAAHLEAERVAREAAEAARLADAQALAAKGLDQQSDDTLASPVEEFLAPVVVVEEPKGRGLSVTPTWTFEVTDLRALIEYAHGAGAGLRSLLVQPNEKGLASLVKQMGAQFDIPGVRRVEGTPVVRSTGRPR